MMFLQLKYLRSVRMFLISYQKNMGVKQRLMYYHMEIFKKVDIIVTPTTAMTAPIISPTALTVGETNMPITENLMRFVLAGNLLGFPAISVPVGYDKQGLPIGMQLIGRHGANHPFCAWQLP
ncbi:hypothetical protein RDI58_003320 [Solanum bulbocastanum]|uniref:Amidase domain-containing protein n=1 Tax=Solanum bulbocastanum TaxID=147425 RepID=A0AAN8UF16_SOLBU